MAYASTVAQRLPRTFAALGAGAIHPVHVRIIEDETRALSGADAAKADEELAEAARSKTWAQLRYAARRLVLRLDPGSDLDHTTAWDNGGITCPCCLAPLCRHHHRCKQAEGWSLRQPEPGVLVWRTPA
ncbi:MAG: DUF222 domain-containing protein, partial [Streptosporangiaceae bacterium]|nr:DUF222 domain-containing protein [Streptosporangiaceae bacterium]